MLVVFNALAAPTFDREEGVRKESEEQRRAEQEGPARPAARPFCTSNEGGRCVAVRSALSERRAVVSPK